MGQGAVSDDGERGAANSGSLLVLARTFLQPQYGSMPAAFLDSLRALIAAERKANPPRLTRSNNNCWTQKTGQGWEAAMNARESGLNQFFKKSVTKKASTKGGQEKQKAVVEPVEIQRFP